MSMSGGNSYLVKEGYTSEGQHVRLYLYVKPISYGTVNHLTSELSVGMYVNVDFGSIGGWGDYGGSYIGGTTFNGKIPNMKGTRWIAENISISVNHDSAGRATAQIPWKWGVRVYNSYMSGWYEPYGTLPYALPTITMYTACGAPSSFSISSNDFESDISASWSGAYSGTNNGVNSYLIQYSISANASGWSDWYDLHTVNSGSASGTYSQNVAGLVARGYYIKLRIRTQGGAGSSYYSGWVYSNCIRRKPYTACGMPSSFNVSSDNFDKLVSLTWNGAYSGTNNNINGYDLQYATSTNNSSWGSWNTLQSIASTLGSYNININVADKVNRGNYVKFRIRTKGTAGASYYSGYKESNSIIRDPKSKCIAPSSVNLRANSKITYPSVQYLTNIFEDEIIISWSKGTAGDNVTITGYSIQSLTGEMIDDKIVWNNTWNTITTTAENVFTYTVNKSDVQRGTFIKFRVCVIASDINYNSEYVVSSLIKRNILPNVIPKSNVTYAISYSNEDGFELKWKSSTDVDSNVSIEGYEIFARYSSGIGSQTWSQWSQIASIRGTAQNSVILNCNNDKTKVSINTGVLNNINGVFSEDLISDLLDDVQNEQYIEFKIIPVDLFCGASLVSELRNASEAVSIQRYDRSGVAIGGNGTWTDCQIYYGVNGQWIDCDILAGIDGQWVQCSDNT